MGKAYSEDIREAVIKYVERGAKKREASQIFGVGENAIYRWIKQKREQGHLRRKPIYVAEYRKMNPKELIKYVEGNPDKTQKEIAAHFGVAPQSVSEAFQKHKITRKKRLYVTKKGMKQRKQSLKKR